jgi:hypothetical protein
VHTQGASEPSIAVADVGVTASPLAAPSLSHIGKSCGSGGGSGGGGGDERKTKGMTSSRDPRYNVSPIPASRSTADASTFFIFGVGGTPPARGAASPPPMSSLSDGGVVRERANADSSRETSVVHCYGTLGEGKGEAATAGAEHGLRR